MDIKYYAVQAKINGQGNHEIFFSEVLKSFVKEKEGNNWDHQKYLFGSFEKPGN